MELTIVGGIYEERAVFPSMNEIHGSGGRAAAALSDLGVHLTLVSYIGADRKKSIEYLAEQEWGVSLVGTAVPETVKFWYYHGLSRPVIRPTRLPFGDVKPVRYGADNMLQFGMLEGSAYVEAHKVVYDPQNPETPERFGVDGSIADEIAYVLNRGEARRLTGIDDADEAAAALLEETCVEVVVIKDGAAGARVYTGSDSGRVPAYKTPAVWPVGSGDVFAAVFAYYWLLKGSEPTDAAEFGSRAAALYCSGQSLPIRQDRLEHREFEFLPMYPAKMPSEATIYLAGPFFTMGQLWLVEEARNSLISAGFDVFSPYHDVGIGSADQVVTKDLKGIERADVLLALCDGYDPGTLFEVGYAVNRKIPIVAFGEQTSDESMKMLRGTGCTVLDDFTTAVYHAGWNAIQ